MRSRPGFLHGNKDRRAGLLAKPPGTSGSTARLRARVPYWRKRTGRRALERRWQGVCLHTGGAHRNRRPRCDVPPSTPPHRLLVYNRGDPALPAAFPEPGRGSDRLFHISELRVSDDRARRGGLHSPKLVVGLVLLCRAAVRRGEASPERSRTGRGRAAVALDAGGPEGVCSGSRRERRCPCLRRRARRSTV